MPRNANKQRCTYPSCRAWAMRGQTLCNVHAGRVRVAKPPPEIVLLPPPAPEEQRLPTLESEISLLAARRDKVDQMLVARLGEGCDTNDALRYLAVLAQVGKSLAVMLAQRAALGGADEIERFFESVAQEVRALRARGETEM